MTWKLTSLVVASRGWCLRAHPHLRDTTATATSTSTVGIAIIRVRLRREVACSRPRQHGTIDVALQKRGARAALSRHDTPAA